MLSVADIDYYHVEAHVEHRISSASNLSSSSWSLMSATVFINLHSDTTTLTVKYPCIAKLSK